MLDYQLSADVNHTADLRCFHQFGTDIYWKDVSADVFGAAQLSADGIGGAARTVTQGIYFIDTATIGLKMMIKVVAENDDGTQDNETKIRIKKGY